MPAFPTFRFPDMTTRPSGAFAPAQIDFSKLAKIADSYYQAQDDAAKRQAAQEDRAHTLSERQRLGHVRQAFAAGIPKDADGNLDIPAIANEMVRLGEIEKGMDLLKGHDPLTRQMKHAELDRTRAQAQFYGRRASGELATGATERIIDRLMSENPDLSYEEAVSLARRAPQDDTLRRERLAFDAYRNDPSRSLEEWQTFYGVPARSGGAQSHIPPAPHVQKTQPHAPAMSAPTKSRLEQFAAPGLGSSGPAPPAGARQAPDGNWYIPDPNRPGKYLKVNP